MSREGILEKIEAGCVTAKSDEFPALVSASGNTPYQDATLGRNCQRNRCVSVLRILGNIHARQFQFVPSGPPFCSNVPNPVILDLTYLFIP